MEINFAPVFMFFDKLQLSFSIQYRKKIYANEKPSEVSNLVSLQAVAVENAPLDALAYELGLSRGIAIE